MGVNSVVIEKLTHNDYERECVTLTHDYGTSSWDIKKEVIAIKQAIENAMDKLNLETGIKEKFKNRPVIVKPNLVLVYNDIGTVKKYYPETTDPRVLDALIVWLKNKAECREVIIAESSGRGAPTRANFRLSGVDRIAKHRGCQLVALEEQPTVRYALPRAKVQQEILIPELFDHVVKGEYAYISVPKLKTNLYTGVTLGFKNAMGVIPYNLRQRAHNYNIDRKLVEMLYLFKPDVVLIDGVVGGEGECPGPVYPVDSRMIIAGNHAVETDRVATRLMGFEPEKIKLLTIADELGFGAKNVKIVGDLEPVQFREPDTSLISNRVQKNFPSITVLYGLSKPFSEETLASIDKDIQNKNAIDVSYIQAMEASCRGGCVASTRLGFAMLEAEGYKVHRPGVLVIGEGLALSGERWWFDKTGTPYTLDAIRKLPGSKAAVGSCSKTACKACDWYVDGCMPLANAPHAILHKLSRTHCKILSVKNKRLWILIKAILEQRRARINVLKMGKRLDVDFPYANSPDNIPKQLSQSTASFLPWPLSPIESRKEKKKLIADEDNMAIASIMGIILPFLTEKISWYIKGVVTSLITWGPLIAGVWLTGSITNLLQYFSLWISHGFTFKFFNGITNTISQSTLLAGILCFLITIILETLHILEIPAAIREYKRAQERGEVKTSIKRLALLILGTLIAGFPAWVPYKLNIERDIEK